MAIITRAIGKQPMPFRFTVLEFFDISEIAQSVNIREWLILNLSVIAERMPLESIHNPPGLIERDEPSLASGITAHRILRVCLHTNEGAAALRSNRSKLDSRSSGWRAGSRFSGAFSSQSSEQLRSQFSGSDMNYGRSRLSRHSPDSRL